MIDLKNNQDQSNSIVKEQREQESSHIHIPCSFLGENENQLPNSSSDNLNHKDISQNKSTYDEKIQSCEEAFAPQKKKEIEEKLLTNGKKATSKAIYPIDKSFQPRHSLQHPLNYQLTMNQKSQVNRGKSMGGGRASLKEGEKVLELVNILKKKPPRDKYGWNIIGRIRFLLKFLRELKRAVNFRAKERMSNAQFAIINDKAHIYKEGISKYYPFLSYQTTKSFETKILKLFQVIKAFSPDNILILLYNNIFILSITIIVTFYEMVISSFNGINSEIMNNEFYNQFRNCSLIALCIEILFRFNTGTYKQGVIVFNRIEIFREYFLLKLFGVDIYTTLDLLFKLSNSSYVLSLLSFFIRCYKIWRLSQELNDHFRIWYRFPTAWILVKLFFMIILFAHFWGCQFIFIACLEQQAGLDSWIAEENLKYETVLVKYIHAFYFSTISMITIGYGDIVPKTTIEKCYVTIIALVGSCVFSYIVNTIGSIFQEISQKEAAFKQQKNNISDYMAKRNINQNLQLQIIKFLEHSHARQDEGPKKGEVILDSIAKNLKEEIMIQYFGNILKNYQLFATNFSSESLRALSLRLKEVMYGPGEIIFHQGELDSKIFFIQSGEVSLFIERQPGQVEEVGRLGKGQVFGQSGFIGMKPREMAVKCSDTTGLVYLEHEDFLDIMRNFQEDYERYQMIKDEVNFKDKKLDTKCSSCGSYEHTILECALVKPQFNRFRISLKYIYPVSQKRLPLIREREKFHTFLFNLEVRECLRRLRNDLALKFEANGDAEEECEDNDITDGGNMETARLMRMDDREYFMNQKMQFKFLDGEIVNVDSDATQNMITSDDYQSMNDNSVSYKQSRKQSDASQIANESTPDIVVKKQIGRQNSIIKNIYNPLNRQASIVQKSSLFRLESMVPLNDQQILSNFKDTMKEQKSIQEEKEKLLKQHGFLGLIHSNKQRPQLKKKVSILIGGKIMKDEKSPVKSRTFNKTIQNTGSLDFSDEEKNQVNLMIQSDDNNNHHLAENISQDIKEDSGKQIRPSHAKQYENDQISELLNEGSSSFIENSEKTKKLSSQLLIDMNKIDSSNFGSSSSIITHKNAHTFADKKENESMTTKANKESNSQNSQSIKDLNSSERIQDIGKCLNSEGSDSDLSNISPTSPECSIVNEEYKTNSNKQVSNNLGKEINQENPKSQQSTSKKLIIIDQNISKLNLINRYGNSSPSSSNQGSLKESSPINGSFILNEVKQITKVERPIARQESIQNGLENGIDVRKLIFARTTSKYFGGLDEMPQLYPIKMKNMQTSPLHNQPPKRTTTVGNFSQIQGNHFDSSSPSTPSIKSQYKIGTGTFQQPSKRFGFTPESSDSFSQSVQQKQGVQNNPFRHNFTTTPGTPLKSEPSSTITKSAQGANNLPQQTPVSVSNENIPPDFLERGDLFLYEFDLMKEFKKFYPQHNYKRVIAGLLRTRKQAIPNKSLHNNSFIQKIVNKKKAIPRRAPSLMQKFAIKAIQEEDD